MPPTAARDDPGVVPEERVFELLMAYIFGVNDLSPMLIGCALCDNEKIERIKRGALPVLFAADFLNSAEVDDRVAV